MISIVRNGIIILEPCVIPKTWTDPDTKIQWSNFDNTSLADLGSFGRKDVVDEPLSFNPLYEQSTVSDWRYDSVLDVVTRDYTITDRPIEDVRAERLVAVRLHCNQGILAVIDIYQQMNLANGIIPDLGYTDWIALMITESNRCEDLYTDAVTMNDLRVIVWDFPTYSWEG